MDAYRATRVSSRRVFAWGAAAAVPAVAGEAVLPAAVGRRDAARGAVSFAQDVPFRVDTLASGLQKPSALVFLPDGRGLLADRGAGTISLLDVARGGLLPLEGVPPSYTGNLEDDAAGVHDVVLHPRYEENGWIYVSYTEGDSVRSRMVVDRLRLRGSAFTELRFTVLPSGPTRRIRG